MPKGRASTAAGMHYRPIWAKEVPFLRAVTAGVTVVKSPLFALTRGQYIPTNTPRPKQAKLGRSSTPQSNGGYTLTTPSGLP